MSCKKICEAFSCWMIYVSQASPSRDRWSWVLQERKVSKPREQASRHSSMFPPTGPAKAPTLLFLVIDWDWMHKPNTLLSPKILLGYSIHQINREANQHSLGLCLHPVTLWSYSVLDWYQFTTHFFFQSRQFHHGPCAYKARLCHWTKSPGTEHTCNLIPKLNQVLLYTVVFLNKWHYSYQSDYFFSAITIINSLSLFFWLYTLV